jgi:hypothetical protein
VQVCYKIFANSSRSNVFYTKADGFILCLSHKVFISFLFPSSALRVGLTFEQQCNDASVYDRKLTLTKSYGSLLYTGQHQWIQQQRECSSSLRKETIFLRLSSPQGDRTDHQLTFQQVGHRHHQHCLPRSCHRAAATAVAPAVTALNEATDASRPARDRRRPAMIEFGQPNGRSVGRPRSAEIDWWTRGGERNKLGIEDEADIASAAVAASSFAYAAAAAAILPRSIVRAARARALIFVRTGHIT